MAASVKLFINVEQLVPNYKIVLRTSQIIICH